MNNLIEATNYFLEAKEFSLPNENSLGKPIAQTEEALKNFWNWFGDSKVVDENGRPLVCYHGSEAVFDEFDYKHLGTHGRSEGVGFYFTDAKEVADGYGKTLQVYLVMKKPLSFKTKVFSPSVIMKILDIISKEESKIDGVEIADGFLSNYGDIRSDGLNRVLRYATEILSSNNTANDLISDLVSSGVSPQIVVNAVCKVTGNDGVIASGFGDEGQYRNGKPFKIFVATIPSQIKSIDNVGTFSKTSNKITEEEQ